MLLLYQSSPEERKITVGDNEDKSEHFGERARLLLSMYKSVEHAEARMKKLRRKDRDAINQEFMEWIEDREIEDDDIAG